LFQKVAFLFELRVLQILFCHTLIVKNASALKKKNIILLRTRNSGDPQKSYEEIKQLLIKLLKEKTMIY